MLVWIVSHDVAFSYDLKKMILGNPVMTPFRKGLKVEVFQSADVLREPSKKTPGPAFVQPSLLILDPFPEEETLEIYLSLLKAASPVVQKVLFCSSMSYGRFVDFFQRKGMEAPPFVPKSDIAVQLDKLLSSFLTDENPPSITPAPVGGLPPPLARKLLEDVRKAIARLEERYYGEVPVTQGLEALLGDVEKIRHLSAKAGFRKVSEEAAAFLSFLSGGKLATPLRIKRELREFLNLCAVILKTSD